MTPGQEIDKFFTDHKFSRTRVDSNCGRTFYTPLMVAIREQSPFCVKKYIIDNSKDLNKHITLVPAGEASTRGYTPLHFCVDKLDDSTIEYLLQKGADRNIKAVHGKTPGCLLLNNLRNILFTRNKQIFMGRIIPKTINMFYLLLPEDSEDYKQYIERVIKLQMEMV